MMSTRPARVTGVSPAAVRLCGSAGWSGSTNQNRLPRPGSLSAPISPPISLTSSADSRSPSPVTPNERYGDASTGT